MKPEFENIDLIKTGKRFEIEVNGHAAFIDYREMGHQIALVHTEADPELAGTGAAAAVVEKTLHYIEENGKKLLPFCPYVFAYIKKIQTGNVLWMKDLTAMTSFSFHETYGTLRILITLA